MIYNIGFMINVIIQFICKDLYNLLRFLSFYNLLREVCLVKVPLIIKININNI